MVPAPGTRLKFTRDGAERLDVEVPAFGAAADVLHVPRAPPLEHPANRRAVVAHVKLVAHVAAVAIDRKRLVDQRVEDHQRDQLLRKLSRTVVVRAVRRTHG